MKSMLNLLPAWSNGNYMIRSVVINLERHIERLSWFTENARQVNLPFERINAVDVHDSSVQSQIDAFIRVDSAMSRAEVACFLSHSNAWKKLLESDESFIAVFEDDVHLSKDISNLLTPESIPKGIGLVKLECPLQRVSYVHRAYAKLAGRSLHRLLTSAYGAAAYIISRDCARRALQLMDNCNKPVDFFLFNPESPIWNEFAVLQIVPAPCIQDHALSRLNLTPVCFESSIEIGRYDKAVSRRMIKEKNKTFFRNVKIPRYLSCVLKGANPFRYKDYVTLDLGCPSMK